MQNLSLHSVWNDLKSQLKPLPTAEHSARLLLYFVTKSSWQDIFTHPDRCISDEQYLQLQQLVKRCLNGESIYRILGERGFYGYDFYLSSATLEPRPDTESLIDLMKQFLPIDRPLKGLDIGTGSGILPITLCLEFKKNIHMCAVDISAEALKTAQRNADRHNVANYIQFIQSDVFSNVKECFDFIISNPPYIASDHLNQLDKTVIDFDPIQALDGGKDGLDFYRLFAQDAIQYLKPKGFIGIEIGFDQKDQILKLFSNAQWHFIAEQKDLGGHVRALLFQKQN